METRETQWKRADSRHPRMGLNNKICVDPQYWCRLHQVWLSEKDVEQKGCKRKITYNMMDVRVCNCLEKKEFKN